MYARPSRPPIRLVLYIVDPAFWFSIDDLIKHPQIYTYNYL